MEYSIIPFSARKFHCHRDKALVELKVPVKHGLIDIYFAFIKPTLNEGKINMNIKYMVCNIKMI